MTITKQSYQLPGKVCPFCDGTGPFLLESFDDFPGPGAQVTTVFVEQGGKTTMTATVLSPSKEVRGLREYTVESTAEAVNSKMPSVTGSRQKVQIE